MSNLKKIRVLSSKHSFDQICMKLCQNVCHHELSDKIEIGSSWVLKKVIRSNLRKNVFTLYFMKLFQNVYLYEI